MEMVDQGRWHSPRQYSGLIRGGAALLCSFETDKQCIMVEWAGVSMELLLLGWTKLVAAVAH